MSFAVPDEAHAATKAQQAKSVLTTMVNNHQTSKDVRSYKIPLATMKSEFNKLMAAHYGEDAWVLNKHTFYSVKSGGVNYVTRINMNYTLSKAQIKNSKSKASSLAKSIVKGKKTQKDKVRAIHDYLIKNTAYYTASAKWAKVSGEQRRAPYTVFYKHRGNCEGHSGAFVLLCKAAGIDAKVVYGYKQGKLHAWNKVKISGKWYYVDVCGDDPLISGKTDSSKVYTTYWMKSKAQMQKLGYRFVTS